MLRIALRVRLQASPFAQNDTRGQRATNGRPYIENGENDVQISCLFSGAKSVYPKNTATPYLKILHPTRRATIGRPSLILPQKVIETLCFDEVSFAKRPWCLHGA